MQDPFLPTDLEKVIDQLGRKPHTPKAGVHRYIQDVALVQGPPGTDVAKNERGIRPAEDKRIGMGGSDFTLEGSTAPRNPIAGLLDGKDLFQVLLGHPPYREKHGTSLLRFSASILSHSYSGRSSVLGRSYPKIVENGSRFTSQKQGLISP